MSKYYLFKVSLDDETEKTFRLVMDDDEEYINYNKYLNNCFGENIVDNEDYIALTDKQQSYMILSEDNFDLCDLENVYEILYDSLYMKRGGEDEKNNNCKWACNFG